MDWIAIAIAMRSVTSSKSRFEWSVLTGEYTAAQSTLIYTVDITERKSTAIVPARQRCILRAMVGYPQYPVFEPPHEIPGGAHALVTRVLEVVSSHHRVGKNIGVVCSPASPRRGPSSHLIWGSKHAPDRCEVERTVSAGRARPHENEAHENKAFRPPSE